MTNFNLGQYKYKHLQCIERGHPLTRLPSNFPRMCKILQCDKFFFQWWQYFKRDRGNYIHISILSMSYRCTARTKAHSSASSSAAAPFPVGIHLTLSYDCDDGQSAIIQVQITVALLLHTARQWVQSRRWSQGAWNVRPVAMHFHGYTYVMLHLETAQPTAPYYNITLSTRAITYVLYMCNDERHYTYQPRHFIIYHYAMLSDFFL